MQREAMLTQLGYVPNDALLKQLQRIEENTTGYEKIQKHIMDLHDHLKIDDAYVAMSNSNDFFKIKKKYKYIVADFPYGLNTAIMGNLRVTRNNRKQIKKYLDKFYSGIIRKLEKILLKRAVVIFPSYFNYKIFIKKSKLKLTNEFDSYVHGNLTRKIVVLEK